MKAIYLTKLAGAKYSQAEMFLANKLRTMKSHYTDKDSFIKHLMSPVGDMEFSRAEALRIYDAMHSVTFYDSNADRQFTGMDDHHRLTFKAEYYKNNSNFFENYARSIFEECKIVVRKGHVPGKKKACTPKMLAHLENMRAAKAAKKEQLSKEQEAPKEEVLTEDAPIKTNLFDGLTLDELREAQNQLTEAIMAAQAEEKRRADIRHQYETLRNAAAKILEENPWLQ